MSLGLYELGIILRRKIFGIQPEENDIRFHIHKYQRQLRALDGLVGEFTGEMYEVVSDGAMDESLSFVQYPVARGIVLFRNYQDNLQERISWLEQQL